MESVLPKRSTKMHTINKWIIFCAIYLLYCFQVVGTRPVDLLDSEISSLATDEYPSDIPCNIILSDKELAFTDCKTSQILLKHALKSDLYGELLQKKNDIVILKPNHNRSELAIGCPFNPDIRLCIITEGHEQLTYAFMIRDRIKDAICKANDLGSRNALSEDGGVYSYSTEFGDFDRFNYHAPHSIDMSEIDPSLSPDDSASMIAGGQEFGRFKQGSAPPSLAPNECHYNVVPMELQSKPVFGATKPWNWNQMDIGMDEAKTLLEDDGRIGNFLVRRSERNPNKLTIDVLVEEGNVKSLRFGNENPEGRFVLDYEKERCARYEERAKTFATVDELIKYYCDNQLKFKKMHIQLKRYD